MFGFKKKYKSEVGLVLDWQFHKEWKWVSAFGHYMAEAILSEFNPVIITSQKEYNKAKKKVPYMFSFEPGWASPSIVFDPGYTTSLVLFSDLHLNTDFKRDCMDNNNITKILSFYYSPFFYHLSEKYLDRFVHFPWAVPDEFVNNKDLIVKSNDVVIFGGANSDAYDVRNWCREQEGVVDYKFSGTENKKMTDAEFYMWLQNFDAVIAAGSSDPKYDLVTPKYFEIAASGSLLFGQYCKDLERLGFNDSNSIIFTKEDFNDKLDEYKKDPEKYLDHRRNGVKLITERHMISHRINTIKELFDIK